MLLALEQIKLNWLTLSFPPYLEKDYLENYFRKSLNHFRLSLLFAIFFYSFFGILDAWLVPDVKEHLWLIRYSVFLPIVGFVFLFSFHRGFKPFSQPFIAFSLVIAGFGVIAMTVIAPYPSNYSYYAGLILVLIYGYTFLKLRFKWASFAGWTIVVAYEFSAIFLNDAPTPVLINNNFFFLTGNLIGMFACYSIEYYSRKDFLQAILLEKEKKKVDEINSALEDRVAERTEQLVQVNKELRQEISERIKSEKALSESEKKYRTILENIEEGFFEVDLKGTLTFCNSSLCRITGYSRLELLGMNNRDYTHPETSKRMFNTFNRVYRTGKPAIVSDFEILTKNNQKLIFELSANLIKDDDDIPVGFRGIVRDVSERLRAAKEKKKLEQKVLKARTATILGLAKLAEYRDTDTGQHLERIREYSKLIASNLAVNPKYKEYISEWYIEDIFHSSILHDIGKVGVPDTILRKPSKLTADEFEIMKHHTILGGDALNSIDSQTSDKSFLTIGKEIAYFHHEKWDGTGYPIGLKGEDIPLSARIVAIADIYDALVSKRIYKKAMSHDEARQIILNERGKALDPDIVDAFLSIEKKFNEISCRKKSNTTSGPRILRRVNVAGVRNNK